MDFTLFLFYQELDGIHKFLNGSFKLPVQTRLSENFLLFIFPLSFSF